MQLIYVIAIKGDIELMMIAHPIVVADLKRMENNYRVGIFFYIGFKYRTQVSQYPGTAKTLLQLSFEFTDFCAD